MFSNYNTFALVEFSDASIFKIWKTACKFQNNLSLLFKNNDLPLKCEVINIFHALRSA